MSEKSSSPRKINPLSLRDVAIMSGQIGFTVAVSALIFVLGGRWLDEKFGTGNTFAIIGIVLGMLAAITAVWNIVKPLQENAKRGFEEMKKTKESSPPDIKS